MILGVDPGLANVGWALLNHGALQYGHIETEKSDQPGDAARRLAAAAHMVGRITHPSNWKFRSSISPAIR